MQKRLTRIYISHSSSDLAFTERLAQDLRMTLADPEAVWYDTSHLSGGESRWSTILAELDRSTTYLIVCSPQAMQSSWVNDEINIVWRRRNSDPFFRLIPLLYQPSALRPDLATLPSISFLKPTPYPQAFQKLLKALGVGVPSEQQEIQWPAILSDGARLIEQGSLLLTRRLSRRIVIGGATTLLVTGGSMVWWLDTHVAQSTPVPLIGTSLYTYTGHSDYVNAVAWSPDGMHIASGSSDTTVRVWNAVDGSHPYTNTANYGAVLAVAWSPDGKWIASAGSWNGIVQVRNAADGTQGTQPYIYKGHSLPALAAAWSPDGKRIASGSGDHTVQVWNAADGSHPYTYKRHSNWVEAVAWSPDGKRIASGSYDHTAQVWDS